MTRTFQVGCYVMKGCMMIGYGCDVPKGTIVYIVQNDCKM